MGNLPALKEAVWAILQHREWTVDDSVGNQRALTVKVWAATGAPRTADSGPLSLCVLWDSTAVLGRSSTRLCVQRDPLRRARPEIRYTYRDGPFY